MDETRVTKGGAEWVAPSPVPDLQAIASAPTAATRYPTR